VPEPQGRPNEHASEGTGEVRSRIDDLSSTRKEWLDHLDDDAHAEQAAYDSTGRSRQNTWPAAGSPHRDEQEGQDNKGVPGRV